MTPDRRRKIWPRIRPCRDSTTPPDPATAQDYECFLAGHHVEFLQRHRMLILHWAWINALAHRTNEQIAQLASQPLTARTSVQPPGTWNDAIAYLAGVILAAAQTRDQTLAQLQKTTLVPLELKLAQSSQANPRTPDELVATVVAALYPSNA